MRVPLCFAALVPTLLPARPRPMPCLARLRCLCSVQFCSVQRWCSDVSCWHLSNGLGCGGKAQRQAVSAEGEGRKGSREGQERLRKSVSKQRGAQGKGAGGESREGGQERRAPPHSRAHRSGRGRGRGAAARGRRAARLCHRLLRHDRCFLPPSKGGLQLEPVLRAKGAGRALGDGHDAPAWVGGTSRCELVKGTRINMCSPEAGGWCSPPHVIRRRPGNTHRSCMAALGGL